MNQLRPILRGNPTRAQRLVLSSAKLDQPSRHGKSQTLAALGLGGTLVATTQTAGAVTAVTVSSTSVPIAAGPVISLALAALKGVAAGLIAGSVVYGLIVSVRGSEQPGQQTSEKQQGLHKLASPRAQWRPFKNSPGAVGVAPTETTSDVAPIRVEEVAASTSRQTLQATESTPRRAAAAETQESSQRSLPPAGLSRTIPMTGNSNEPQRGPAASAASSAATASVATTSAATAAMGYATKDVKLSPLESEIAILDAAQRAFAAGRPSVALQNLDTHRRLFANPHLLPEATLVRIESLLALGRSIEARKLGEQLLSAQPTGALSQRVRSLLNQPPKP